jgi:catechol 2,3-dioxygenase-like lactoylglutathione lyase family enzyme
MPVRGVDHIDLAVSDVERSLAFYLGMLGPIGLAVEGRFRTYRGTEDVVYLTFGQITWRPPNPARLRRRTA